MLNHVNIVCRLIYLFILLINLVDRELCYFPNNWYQSPGYRGTRIFLVCSVVAAFTDLPHQKRIFFEPYFFCQF